MTQIADRTSLEQTVRDLQDREEIRELGQLYCFLVDTQQIGRIPDEIYTEDAEDVHSEQTTPPYVAKGRDQISSLFNGILEHFEATQHIITNQHIDVRGDRATSRAYVLALHWLWETNAAGATRPADSILSCAYDDELVRTDQGWRIQRRRLHTFGPGSSLAIGWLPAVLSPGIGSNLYAAGDS